LPGLAVPALGQRPGPLPLGQAAELEGDFPIRGARPAQRRQRGSRIGLLTPQELQVALEIAAGRSNPAGALFLSRKTVEAHLSRIYRKLEVRSRTELTRALVEAQLADL
jgi:DNA-binding NarL/FixJ family response regulator